MEEHTSSTRSVSAALEHVADSMEATRTRARQMLVAQRERLELMEAELARHMQTVAEELQRDRTDLEQQQSSVREQLGAIDQQRAALLADQNDTLQQQQTLAVELQHQHDELEQRARQVHEREAKLAASEAALRDLQRQHQRAQQELEEQSAEVARGKKRLEEKQQALDALRDRLEEEASETKLQRRRIARELKEQHDRLRAERAELEAAAAAQAQAAQGDAQQSDELRQKLDLAIRDARDLKRRNAELEEELASRPSGEGASQIELAQLRQERDALAEQLKAAEAKLKSPPSESSLQHKMQDLQRRFEMAVEDLREVKNENSELKEQLAEARQAQQQRAASRPAQTDGPLDWEAQKQRLLAALEDFDEENEEEQEDRLTIEGTIHITDEVVAEKDREIAELKQLLDQQSSSLGEIALGATAIAAALDQDELICEERERLAALKAEWEAKLRQAEVDLSLERAQLARQKAEIEARAHSLQSEFAKLDRPGQTGKDEKSGRGRWLARLGLKENEEKDS